MQKDSVPESWVECPRCHGKGFVLGLGVRLGQRSEQRTKPRCVLCDGLGIVDAVKAASDRSQGDLFGSAEG